MGDLLHLNLIQLFTFYLTAAFVLSTFRRVGQYHDAAQLVLNAPGRWPRVVQQVRRHRMMFFTWAILRPALLALILLLTQWVLSRLIWPKARITGEDLLREWWTLIPLGLTAAAMLSVDLYGIIRVGRIDRRETEKYLDEAEHWMTSWKAPLVKVLTLGYVNPRQMVDVEVRKALEDTTWLLQRTLWWMSLQAACRIAFGLTLWLSWAFLPGRTPA